MLQGGNIPTANMNKCYLLCHPLTMLCFFLLCDSLLLYGRACVVERKKAHIYWCELYILTSNFAVLNSNQGTLCKVIFCNFFKALGRAWYIHINDGYYNHNLKNCKFFFTFFNHSQELYFNGVVYTILKIMQSRRRKNSPPFTPVELNIVYFSVYHCYNPNSIE